MKNLLILLFALFSLNSFAKGFIKNDSGVVTWQIKKDTLITPIELYSSEVITKGLSQDMRIALEIWNNHVPLGYRGEYVVYFTKSENIEEKVKSMVRNKLHELFEVPFPHTELSNIVTFEDIKCEKKGFIKRYTVCSAIYKSKIEVELD